MKASQLSAIFKGVRAIRRVPLPIATDGRAVLEVPQEGPVEQGAAVSASPEIPFVGIRALTDLEKLEALEGATAQAKSKGGEPVEGNPIFDVALRDHALAVACIDIDDPQQGRFFDGGAEQIQGCELLCGDAVALLFEHYLLQNEVVNPGLQLLDEKGLDTIIEKGAGPDGADFFLRLPLSLRVSSWLFMAHRLWNSRERRSPSGSASSSGANGRSLTPSPPTGPDA